MEFIADLHIHSRFSLATSKRLNIAHLSEWAMAKGINVLGTGDFTHPKWFEELSTDLEFDEDSGLMRPVKKLLPQSVSRAPYFCLQTEISCIYKKDGKTRKVHNLVFAPNLEIAKKISDRLALIGNINSDGRPILGLDSRNLLEIVLECSPECVLVPAHIWTPWFALFGSKSGFDRIEDCYGDLTSHIFALETGLSSDPAMNRCLSALDNYALISNSDAHSGANLGREANLFNGSPSWHGMFNALRIAARRENPEGNGCQFMGTIEFFPEEGKYHLDGHRACGIVLSPSESRQLGNICPVCGKPLTIGVLNRVMELADRSEAPALPYEPEARMFVPLQEIIAQIMQAGSSSRKVQEKYDSCVSSLGSELDILGTIPENDVRAYWEPLGEAVARLRSGNVILHPGFDGQYGVIQIFGADEQKELKRGKSTFLPGINPFTNADKVYTRQNFIPGNKSATIIQALPISFSNEQKKAIDAGEQPVFIQAGPGAGKTRVLVARIQRLLESGVLPSDILALTFTRKAAGEMSQRLSRLVTEKMLPECSTLHALAWKHMHESGNNYLLLGDDSAKRLFMEANASLQDAATLWEQYCLARENMQQLAGLLHSASLNYQMRKRDFAPAIPVDYLDLIEWLVANDGAHEWPYVCVDELQDLSPLQLRAIFSLTREDGKGFFGIGDPDQSIYSFRGAEKKPILSLQTKWPDLKIITLRDSYRSGQKILEMAANLLGKKSTDIISRIANPCNIQLTAFPTGQKEAQWIAKTTKKLIGSTSHSLADSSTGAGTQTPSDIAILVRVKAQIPLIAKALEDAGIPFTAPETRPAFWRDEQCAKFLDLALLHNQGLSPEKYLAYLQVKSENADLALLDKSEAFAELCSLWEAQGSWKGFFERLAWLEEAREIGELADGVRILTLHAAKGLEFSTVFIPGFEQGLIPLDRNLLFNRKDLPGADLDEEKRLLYVGITRASGNLFLSYCKRRIVYGREFSLEPSIWMQSLAPFCKLAKQVVKKVKISEPINLFTESGHD